jgi:hypothetical protein
MGSWRIHWCSNRRPCRCGPRWRSRLGCILPVVLPSLLVSLPAILLSAVLSGNGSTRLSTVRNAVGPGACLRILVDAAEIRIGSTQFTRLRSAELPNQGEGGFASGTEGLEQGLSSGPDVPDYDRAQSQRQDVNSNFNSDICTCRRG